MAGSESSVTELKVARLEGAYEHLATRADVENLRGELRAEINELRGELRAEMNELRGELRGEMGGLRGEMTGLRGEVRLLAGLVIGVQVAAVALIFSRVAG